MFPRKRSLIVLVAVMVLAMTACATTQQPTQAPSFAEAQYKALAASQELYNLSWGAFKRLYDTKAVNKEGKLIVDQERYTMGFQLATTYYNAWMTWITAVMDYERVKGANGAASVEQAMAVAQKASLELMKLIQPYLEQGGK